MHLSPHHVDFHNFRFKFKLTAAYISCCWCCIQFYCVFYARILFKYWANCVTWNFPNQNLHIECWELFFVELYLALAFAKNFFPIQYKNKIGRRQKFAYAINKDEFVLREQRYTHCISLRKWRMRKGRRGRRSSCTITNS